MEYRCVQDADLLDAIGAIGIARCFAFSGKRNRKLFGLSRTQSDVSQGITHQEYMTAQVSTTDSAVDHFFDKLLTIEPARQMFLCDLDCVRRTELRKHIV